MISLKGFTLNSHIPKLRIKTLIGLIITLTALSFRGNTQSVSGVINTYHRVTNVNTLTNTLTVVSPAGLAAGQRILIIQMKGATINTTNSASFGNMVAINNAGNYELNTICAIVGNDVMLQNVLLRSYTAPAGAVQIVTVPQYTSVTVTDSLRATPWSGASGTGGVIALRATDTIYLNSGVTASGAGFSGGPIMDYPTPTYDCIWTTDVTPYFLAVPPTPSLYYTGGWKGEGIADYISNAQYGRGKQANGGGGGNNHNAGGGGGANYGTGGNGGRRAGESPFQCHGANAGVGGLSLSTVGYAGGANNKIFLGGGGGNGHGNNLRQLAGGAGGGIIILIANVITSSGRSILSNGHLAYNIWCFDDYSSEGDGSGGGGAGGTIVLDVNTINGTINTEARGANGGNSSHYSTPLSDCSGPGGGGSGGVVWVSAGSFPGAITSIVSGGANGTVSMTSALACRGSANGATPGTAGANLTGHTLPIASTFTCAPLAAPNLKYFKGKINSGIATLQWEVFDGSITGQYILEESEDGINFNPISFINNNGNRIFAEKDGALKLGTNYYRLKILNKNASIEYSSILRLNNDQVINPEGLQLVTDNDKGQLLVNFRSYLHSSGKLILLKTTGEKISEQSVIIKPGMNKESVNTLRLPNGTYIVCLLTDNNKYSKKFLIQK